VSCAARKAENYSGMPGILSGMHELCGAALRADIGAGAVHDHDEEDELGGEAER
jgi:hypothetical protein